jgi:hypothetical protein
VSQVSLYWKMAQMHFIENRMKKYLLLAPPIRGLSCIVVNLLNHERVRGRTSSAAPRVMEDFMAP